tara:strand:+ start:638 stop:1027 length:390 start_codon:yes stop_codon:yes gene_type:complete
MRHRKSRRYNKFRSNGRNYQSRSNGNEQTRIGATSFSNGRGRNNFKSHHNPKQLVDKYNSLAKEALSSGDQILSENYYQHADHYARMVEDRISNQVVNKAPVATEEKTTNDNSNLNSDISKTQDIENKK